MQIIDNRQALARLSEIGISESHGTLSFPEFFKLQYVIPKDSGVKTAISKTIASFFKNDDALLWINEFGIWPSSEDWNLFDGFRKSIGEFSPLHEKPGHIFSKEDSKTVESLLAMVLYFIWGAIVVSRNGDLIIRISHDEMIDIFIKNKEALPDIVKGLSYLEISGS